MPGLSPEIANEFISLAKEKQRAPFTHMQLQKLVYIAHGWCLAINNNPLTIDSPEAWDYGPVYKLLYDALKKYGSHPVEKIIFWGDFEPFSSSKNEIAFAKLKGNENEIVGRVYEKYGNFEAFQLSALTHQTGTPWREVYSSSGRSSIIINEMIRNHFFELARRGRPS